MFSAFRKGEKFKDHFETGIYVCAKCDYELFSRYFDIKRNDRNNNFFLSVIRNILTTHPGQHSLKHSTKIQFQRFKRSQEH